MNAMLTANLATAHDQERRRIADRDHRTTSTPHHAPSTTPTSPTGGFLRSSVRRLRHSGERTVPCCPAQA